jgi:ornithine carbamoyltransferase
MKDLLRTEHLSRADVELLLSTAAEFAENPLRSNTALANKTVAIYMTKPSTRTRLSSETAVAHLGGTPIFIRGDELQLGRGESIEDTAKIISGYCSALIIRTFAQSDVDQLGAFSSIPVINALTDVDHPTQLLADWLTIRENFGTDISGRKFVYLGDGNNMSHAWLIMGALILLPQLQVASGHQIPSLLLLQEISLQTVVEKLKLQMIQKLQQRMHLFFIQMSGCRWVILKVIAQKSSRRCLHLP